MLSRVIYLLAVAAVLVLAGCASPPPHLRITVAEGLPKFPPVAFTVMPGGSHVTAAHCEVRRGMSSMSRSCLVIFRLPTSRECRVTARDNYTSRGKTDSVSRPVCK